MAAVDAPRRATLSDIENLGVGVVGGCAETLALMPVLTWKLCTQEGRPYPCFPGMYRGVGVQAASVAPITAFQMLFNGLIEGSITGGKRAPSEREMVGCALGAGAASAVLYSPVDLATIHQQKLKKGPMATVAHLARTHGVLSLWRGVGSMALREAIYTAGYLGLAPLFTARLMQQPGWSDSYFTSAVLGASAAGVIACVASHPIDTAKTVIQADITGAKYRTLPQSLGALYGANGLRSLYLGGLARTVRTCGAFFIVGVIREKCIVHKSAREAAPW